MSDIYTIMNLVALIMSLAVIMVAGYLCWQCNAKEPQGKRILYTLFASVFSWIYLIYYLIYRVMMGRPC